MSLRIHLASSAEENGMLDLIAANPGLTAALVLAGAALGLLLARLVLPGPKRVRQLEDQLEKAHTEHQAYRSSVTTHFQKTAELVGKMTESYKSVYDHLAYGSQTLCGEYDALTSSVFGPPRIIHDPTMAVGQTTGAGGAASTQAAAAANETETSRGEADMPKTQPRESFRFGADAGDASGSKTAEQLRMPGDTASDAPERADDAADANAGKHAATEREGRDTATPRH
jgi:hypothetical protein